MKLVIFDLDDTLIDFAATRELAYACLSEHLNRRGIDASAFVAGCIRVDRPLFGLFEHGKLTRQEYRLRRFADPLAAMGLPEDAELVQDLNKLFMDCVNDRPKVFEDVHPVLERLRGQGIRTAILTNGPSDGQRRKLAASNLGDMVDHVAIGEEQGFSKPLAQAFHAVLDRFAFAPAEVLMVGDSPELDYDAAVVAGLEARLLDRQGRFNGSERHCIRSLEELVSSPGGMS